MQWQSRREGPRGYVQLKARLDSELNQALGRKSGNATTLLQQLFVNPVTDVNKTMKVCRLSRKAANDLVADLSSMAIKETTGQARNRVFVFQRYLNCFK